jgi:hypothetical protein
MIETAGESSNILINFRVASITYQYIKYQFHETNLFETDP